MYTLDGVPLDDPQNRWYLNAKTGVRILPGRTAAGVVLPGRDGVTPSLGSTYTPGMIKLGLSIRQPTHPDMMGGLELLYGVLSQRHRLLPLVHDYGNGTSRQAMIEVLSSIDPESLLCNFTRLDVIAEVPGVFWRSTNTADTTLAVTTTAATSVIGALAGSTAPVNDALIRVKGGLSGLVLTDPVSGDHLTVTMALGATEYLVIDCANWTARKVTTNTWTGGTDVSQYVLSNRGMGPMFSLNPDFTTGAGRIRLTVKGTNPASSPVVTVRAKQSYF